MPKGIWVWPSDPRGQGSVLRKVAASPHLMAAMAALTKSKEGMSNTELDDAINESSVWTTLWVIRQLTSLGFLEYKVDFFGNPARYELTDQGRAAFSTMTSQPPTKPAGPTSSAPPPAAPPASVVSRPQPAAKQP